MLRPDEVDQRHPQMAAVEIGVDIEEMCFEPRLGRADGRTQADIGDPVDRASVKRIVGAVARHPDRINPEGRPDVFAETEIDGRKADGPPAAIADRDAAVDLPEPAEQRRSLARFPCFQQLSDCVEE